jgi:hypothetical protein
LNDATIEEGSEVLKEANKGPESNTIRRQNVPCELYAGGEPICMIVFNFSQDIN